MTARAGLDESLNLAARWALARGQLDVARHHLSQTATPDPTITAEVEAARTAKQARDAEAEALLNAHGPTVQANDRNCASAITFGMASLRTSRFHAS